MGFIGLGTMGTNNLMGFLGNSDVHVAAVCDVDAGSMGSAKGQSGYRGDGWYGREPAKQRVVEYYSGGTGAYKGCVSYADFRELLARPDIDAVCISTPDHWHVPISIAAVKAGKDVYCEKPLSYSIAEGRVLCETVKRYGAAFQTGTHQRSDRLFRRACEIVRNGRIGKLLRIKTEIYKNDRENVGNNPAHWTAETVPAGFDYDMWLGPAPYSPYMAQRCHYNWHFNLDYSSGQMVNWGVHVLDIGQWGNGTDDSGPAEIEGWGEFPAAGLFNTARSVDVKYTYANGVEMHCKSGQAFTRFEGSEGWVLVQRGFMDAYPKSLLEYKPGPEDMHLYESSDHKRNFLECIKLRREPVAGVETGHRAATVCHLGSIGMQLGRKIKWDPVKETIIGDEAAARMMRRSLREPWTL